MTSQSQILFVPCLIQNEESTRYPIQYIFVTTAYFFEVEDIIIDDNDRSDITHFFTIQNL